MPCKPYALFLTDESPMNCPQGRFIGRDFVWATVGTLLCEDATISAQMHRHLATRMHVVVSTSSLRMRYEFA